MNKNNLIIISSLGLLVLLSIFIGNIIDWQTYSLSAVYIVVLGIGSIKLLSNKLKATNQTKLLVFAITSVIYFAFYSVANFIGYSGGDTALSISLPLILVLSITYVYVLTRYENKRMIIFCNLLIFTSYIFVMIFILGGIGLAGYGSL